MTTQNDIFPFTLTKISPMNPDIEVIAYTYDEGQTVPDPSLDPDIEPNAHASFEGGKLTRIDFASGEYKTYTYVDNLAQADDGLLETIFDSESNETITYTYDNNGVMTAATVT